jgi:hypothetical protein
MQHIIVSPPYSVLTSPSPPPPPFQAEKFPNTLALAQSIQALKDARKLAERVSYRKSREIAMISQDLSASRMETTRQVCRTLQTLLASLDAFMTSSSSPAPVSMTELVRLQMTGLGLETVASNSVRLQFLAVLSPLRFRVAGPFREGGACKESLSEVAAPAADDGAAAPPAITVPSRSEPGADSDDDIYDIFLIREAQLGTAKALGFREPGFSKDDGDASSVRVGRPIWQSVASVLQGELGADLAKIVIESRDSAPQAVAAATEGVLNIAMIKVEWNGKEKTHLFSRIQKDISLSVAQDCTSFKWTTGKKQVFPSAGYTGSLRFVNDREKRCFSVLYPTEPTAEVRRTSEEGLRFCYEGDALWKTAWPVFPQLMVRHSSVHARLYFSFFCLFVPFYYILLCVCVCVHAAGRVCGTTHQHDWTAATTERGMRRIQGEVHSFIFWFCSPS